jgi:hypothetical protein
LASLEALDGWEKDLIRQADSPIFLLSIYTKKANPTNKNTLFLFKTLFATDSRYVELILVLV